MATRLSQAGRDGIDAVVAAAAALDRLDQSARAAERLDPDWFVPQVGQGALALEARSGDARVLEALAVINEPDAFLALCAERAFLRELGAGCSIPAGAYATLEGSTLTLSGVMLALDGSRSVRATLEGVDPLTLGRDLARLLRDEMDGASLPGWDR
jgi:hydroxymethylbilane synthase